MGCSMGWHRLLKNAIKIRHNPYEGDVEIKLTPLDELREFRNILLSECDWTVLPDSQLSAEKVTEWKAYRQALRDFQLIHQTQKNPRVDLQCLASGNTHHSNTTNQNNRNNIYTFAYRRRTIIHTYGSTA